MPILVQLIICVSLLVLLFSFPQASHLGAEQGVIIFGDILLPYLLPYLLLANWLFAILQQRSITTRSALVIAYITSAIGGYPVGAIAVLNLYRQQLITKRQAAWLLPFLHSPNPFFIINYVGVDLLQNVGYSIVYLVLHHMICVAAVTIIYKKSQAAIIPTTDTHFSFQSLLQQTIQTILIVATTIIFFTSITYICVELFLTSIPIQMTVLFIGALELTNGLQFAASQLSYEALLIYYVFLLSSQSFSIHLQVAAIVAGSFSLRPYVIVRAIFTIVFPAMFLLFLSF